MTATNITAPEFIERQARMNSEKCGISPAIINSMMQMDDAKVIGYIKNSRAAIPTLSGEKLDVAERGLRALMIEADIRGLDV